jgi:Holliday junction resolvase RusA-like endonuclease
MASENKLNTIRTLCIVLPGVPVAKQRPRFSRFGTYDKQRDVKELYRLSLLPQLPSGFRVIDSPISLHIVFEMPIPKSTSKKKLQALIGSPHLKKPDLDNLYKMFDAYNGVLWSDDSLIYKITMEKRYSETPQTLLNIEYEQDTRGKMD